MRRRICRSTDDVFVTIDIVDPEEFESIAPCQILHIQGVAHYEHSRIGGRTIVPDAQITELGDSMYSNVIM